MFDQISQRSGPDSRFLVRAGYLEIYNEQVQDLLNPTSASLAVRWSTEKGFYVENLFVVECEVLDDCMAVLEEGATFVFGIYVTSRTAESQDGIASIE